MPDFAGCELVEARHIDDFEFRMRSVETDGCALTLTPDVEVIDAKLACLLTPT